MKKLLFACFACISLLLTSCAVSNEATQNQNQVQTQVVLSQNNFKIVKTASGELQQDYFLCFGGISKKALGSSAMAEMYKNANLKGSQAIINTSVTYKCSTYLGLYSQIKAIATGTVIEFVGANSNLEDCNSASVYNHKEDVHQSVTPSNGITSLSKGNDVVISENTVASRETLSKEAPTHFSLTFLKKGKKSKKWDVIEEKKVEMSYEEALAKAKEWEDKTSEHYDYKCTIKNAKL